MRRNFLFTGLILLVCTASPVTATPQNAIRVVHVFVALADNQFQGIVPVPAKLGDGDAPWTNLYWGVAYGVKSYFRSTKDWKMVSDGAGPGEAVLERCVFRHRGDSVYLVADAYRGRDIRQAIMDFLSAAAGRNAQAIVVNKKSGDVQLGVYGGGDLVAYVGHDALMDFQVDPVVGGKPAKSRAAVILACASKPYFEPYLRPTGASPLLWTTGLMAPEAYTLKAALDGWMAGEDGAKVRQLAAEAYDKYQHCGMRAAERLFTSGW